MAGITSEKYSVIMASEVPSKAMRIKVLAPATLTSFEILLCLSMPTKAPMPRETKKL
jgi:hypothetical protein